MKCRALGLAVALLPQLVLDQGRNILFRIDVSVNHTPRGATLNHQAQLESSTLVGYSVDKNTACCPDRYIEDQEEHEQMSSKRSTLTQSCPSSIPDQVGSRIYKYSCHTCNIHFQTGEGFEKHILQSPTHKSFKLCQEIAEDVGYLKTPDSLNGKSFDHGKSCAKSKSNDLQLCASEPQCRSLGCACPQFEFVPSKHITTTDASAVDLWSFTSLDGAAGSTLHGHRPDEDGDPEDVTLSYEKPLLDIIPEEPYVCPPDSSDEEVVRRQKNSPERTAYAREKQDQFEMRKRFNKRKNRRTGFGHARPAPHRAENKILDAYAAVDEKLFGQKRFEELEDDQEARQESIADWQDKIGMKVTFNNDLKINQDQLTQDIELFIQDVLDEVSRQAEKQNHDKISKNRMFCEDTLEDVAIDHEFRLADQGQEKFRKAIGRKQNNVLWDMNTEGIVDDIAMDHNQEVGEREEEHNRKIISRVQDKESTYIRVDDIVDDLTMDHVQEVGQKEQELHRNIMGRLQGSELTDPNMLDHVDKFSMDHFHETSEKAQEKHRKTIMAIQTKKLTNEKEVNLIESLVMDHMQEVSEKAQEYQRRTCGMEQTGILKLSDRREIDLVLMEGFDDHEKRHRTRSKKRKLVASNMNDIMVSTVEMSAPANPDVDDRSQRSWSTEANQKSNACLGPVGGLTEMGHGYIGAKNTTDMEPGKNQKRVACGQVSVIAQDTSAQGALVGYSGPAGDNHQNATKFELPEMKHGTLGTEFGIKKKQGNEDDDSDTIPAPKKNRRQLRKEANANFEAMMEKMLEGQVNQGLL